jgi:hypothetical protein
LRSGFGSYIGAAAYGAGSCFEAVLQAASNSTKIMALRRAIVDVVFIVFTYSELGLERLYAQ